MIRVIDYEKDSFAEPCVLLLGYFDGMHIGHRALLFRAKEMAAQKECRVGIMTFYDSKNGGQIYSFDERLYLFETLGVDFVYAAHFGDNFRSKSGADFLKHIIGSLQVKAFVCGQDFTYGKGAACGVKDLGVFCAVNNIAAEVMPLVRMQGEKASASLAKEYLAAGETESLSVLLGGKYFIRRQVSTEGRRVGRSIGFPTANIHLSEEKYPLKTGVYAVTVSIGGKIFRGIANYGSRPTFGDGRVVLEVYIDGYAGDLYGEILTVYFDFYIRGVQKFGSAAALSEQLKKDLEKIR